MYAQLCRRLSQEAPNFEPPEQACTFRLLLVNKCRAEFENRANAVYLEPNEQKISTEDEERLHLAKRKMLGNIKFIGELGKLNILHENTLHGCIKELISRRTCDEDLECLAQLVRTCGRILDTEPGRKLMDQYFARMEHIAKNRDLQPRIRFMLRDVIELRKCGWVPRAAVAGEGPVPMGQLRAEQSPPRNAPPMTDPLFRRPRLDHVLAGLTLSSPTTGNLAPVVVGHPGQNRDGFRHRGYYNKNNNYNNKNQQQQNNNNTAPRFNKARIAAAAAFEEVQMRPAANSLLFQATKHRAVAPPLQTTPTSAPAPILIPKAEPPKPAPEKPQPVQNNKKNKGPNKEEVIKQVLAILRGNDTPLQNGSDENPDDLESDNSPDGKRPVSPDSTDIVAKLKELTPPEKFFKDIFIALYNAALVENGDIPAERFASVWSAWRGKAAVEPRGHLEPRPLLPKLLAHLVAQKVWSLSELGGACEAHQPLLLNVLEQLKELVGMESVTQMFNESKIRLSAHVVCSGSAAWEAAGALATALAERGLQSLQPSLALSTALRTAPSDPKALYKWLLQNVPTETRTSAGFAEALVGAILRHGHSGEANTTNDIAKENESTPKEETEASEGSAGARASLRTYGTLLAQMLPKPSQQLAAVYAVQLYCMDLKYPKGVLLQLFIELYELEICERSAFMAWQEDVDDRYPPKGEALFQVNFWLSWLEGQVSSDEEA